MDGERRRASSKKFKRRREAFRVQEGEGKEAKGGVL